MFFTQEMAEIELIVPKGDVVTVGRILAEEGIFHQIDASHITSEQDADTDDHWRGESTAYARLERRILAVMQALHVEGGQPPSTPQAALADDDALRPLIKQLEDQTNDLVDEQSKRKGELEQLERQVHQLESVADLAIDVGALHNMRYIFALLGILPVNRLERLRTSLERIPFVLLTLRRDDHRAVVLLFGARKNADILERAARSAYLNPLNLPESYEGKPPEIIEKLQTEMERVRGQIAEGEAAMADLCDTRAADLRSWLWRVRVSRILTDAIANFGRLQYTYIVVGWAPAARLKSLTQRLGQVSGELFIETDTPRRYEAEPGVPVALRNPGLLHGFQQLVTNYGLPRYAEIDPTVLVTLTFPLLFGAMFGDVGHGLVLALLGWLLLLRRVEFLRGLANLGPLITACGLTAAVFGFLYGSLFGLEDILPAVWLRPLSSIMQILMTAIGLGIVLLSLGFVINMINALTARDWSRLLFEHNGVAGLLLYWSLIGLAATIFLSSLPIPAWVFGVLAAVAGTVVMLSGLLTRLVEGQRPLIEGGIGTFGVQAFFELFETLLSLLSNSLSFVRVGAFAVAHGGLSAVVFILAELISPTRGIGYWIAVALGNLFIVGFEGLIVGIQSLRLEYYEFFSKFFTGGGRRYTPLTLLPETDK
jgi:V/A-type H+-transporting ATPase subunit I